MKLSNFARGLTVCLLTCSLSTPAFATRTMYSTIMQSSLSQDDVTASLGATNRVSVSFQNISNVTQTLSVTIRSVSTTATLSFADQATGQNDFPSWTQYPLSPASRVTSVNQPDNTINLSLAPMGNGYASWSLFCDFKDSFPCITSSSGDATDWVNNTDIRGVGVTSNYALMVTINEDRGAVLADVTSQQSLFTNSSLTGPSNSRSLNGGRPF